MAIDEDRLMEFVDKFVDELGATMAAGSIVVGDRLGLYKILARWPMQPNELAERTGTAPRYIEEWLRGQAAGGYVEYDEVTGKYCLTEEQAFVLTDPDGPIFVPGAFRLALGALKAEREIADVFRTGEGRGWHQHDADVFDGWEGFFGPTYSANLVRNWIPALDGVDARLSAGARVADVACGHGVATTLMAKAYPKSTFSGSDYHAESIAYARKQTAELSLEHTVSFEVASAQTFNGGPYDLVTTFNALHDMGDPLGAARHIRRRLTQDGTWMIVEPAAGSSVSENMNPVGRLYYSFSAFLCVPNALSQEGGYALGAQAGEDPIRRLANDAGFSRFRRVAETPLNYVYEARP